MTHDTELVSLGIAEVGTVVVLVILGPQARWALRHTSMIERDSIRSIDKGAIASQERDHLAISRRMRRLVVWFANEKQGPRPTGALPAGPRTAVIAESGFVSKARHERAIEPQSSLEVTDPCEDV